MNKNIIYLGLALVVVIVVVMFWSMGKSAQTADSQNATDNMATDTSMMATDTSMMGTSSTPGVDSNQMVASKPIPGYPSSWPADVPKYPVEKVTYNGGNNPQSGPKEATVVFTTPGAVKSVLNFYLDGLKANGWTITENGNGLANQITFRATKARRYVGGYIVREANGKTTVTVGVNIGL